MRASPEYNHLEVFAQYDGISLLEHLEVFSKPTHRSPATYTSYLEIPTNSRVSLIVRCPDNQAYQGDLMSDPEIDGRPLCTAFLKAGSRQTVEHTTFSATSGEKGEYDMILSREVGRGEDGEAVLLDGCAKEVVGEIKVDIWRGTLYGAVDRVDNQPTDTGLDCDSILTYYNGLIPVRLTVKRCVSSMAVQQVTCAESRFESIEGADPWVRFVFKYATREALVALGITSQLAPRTVIHSHNATRERSTTPSEAFVLVPASPEQAVVATRSLETPSGLSVTTPTHDIAGSELARPVESSDSSLLNEKESRAEDSAVEMEETGFGESAVDYTSLLDVCLQNQVQANLHDPAETFSKLVTVPIPEVTSSKQGEQAVYEDEEDYQALYEALSLIPPEDLRTLDAALVDYATVSETTMSADLQPRAGKTSATTTTIIKDKHRRTKPAHSHIRTTDLSTSSAFASRPAVPTLTSTSGSSLHRPTQSQTRSTTIPAQSGHMDINQRKRKERSLDQDTNNIHGHRSSRDDRTYHESMRSRESGTTTMHKDKKRGTDSRTRLREKVEPLFFTEELWSSDDDSRHAYTVKSRTTLVHKHSHSHSHSHGHSHGHSLRIGFDDTIASKLTSRDHFASKAGSSSRGHVVSKAESSSRKHVVLEAGSSSRGHVVSKAGSSSRGHVVSKAESSSRDHAASKAGSSSRRQIRSTQPPLLSRLRSQLEPDDLPSSQLRSITAFPAHPKSKRKH